MQSPAITGLRSPRSATNATASAINPPKCPQITVTREAGERQVRMASRPHGRPSRISLAAPARPARERAVQRQSAGR